MADYDTSPISMDGLSATLALVLVETVTVCSQSTKQADERLEELASRLLTFAGAVADPANETKRLLAAVARDLISTEEPGGQITV